MEDIKYLHHGEIADVVTRVIRDSGDGIRTESKTDAPHALTMSVSSTLDANFVPSVTLPDTEYDIWSYVLYGTGIEQPIGYDGKNELYEAVPRPDALDNALGDVPCITSKRFESVQQDFHTE